jgi:hypothetical protein
MDTLKANLAANCVPEAIREMGVGQYEVFLKLRRAPHLFGCYLSADRPGCYCLGVQAAEQGTWVFGPCPPGILAKQNMPLWAG